ncbi:hypothetical protein [Pedobacter africanus]|uniref:Type IV pilus biogenesis n=1 Tax=Pedobacter africanus TaxID=151894 RepID=A0A1W2EFG3_9SPHI|nr:hypothetical protein [Pedobacter africanus]SMD08439.1 hypothetical protein SAMN04488524_4764 [Pedobacter africanus]
MKNKKALLYVLGFLVVCIWGIIIMRVYAAVGDEAGGAVVMTKQGDTVKTHIPVLQPDTFQLLLNYGDPFDAVAVKEAPVVAAAGNLPVVKPMASPQVVQPVTAKYLGFIWNAENKKKIAIMNQDGKEVMVQEGETIGQLQLLGIASDSVKVKYKGKTSFIRINK